MALVVRVLYQHETHRRSVAHFSVARLVSTEPSILIVSTGYGIVCQATSPIPAGMWVMQTRYVG